MVAIRSRPLRRLLGARLFARAAGAERRMVTVTIYLLEAPDPAGNDTWRMTVYTDTDRDRVCQTWRDQGREEIKVNGNAWVPKHE